MSDPFADEVERLRETAGELPRLFGEAVDGVAVYAAALAELVENLDARRSELNEQAQLMGAPPIPDLVGASVPAWDAVRAPLVAAARRGPGELAVRLGMAARSPAGRPGASTPFEGESMGEAARAATALMALAHHGVEEVRPQDLLADVDPARTAMLLAGIAVQLAGQVMPETAVAAWIASRGAAWAVDGDQ